MYASIWTTSSQPPQEQNTTHEWVHINMNTQRNVCGRMRKHVISHSQVLPDHHCRSNGLHTMSSRRTVTHTHTHTHASCIYTCAVPKTWIRKDGHVGARPPNLDPSALLKKIVQRWVPQCWSVASLFASMQIRSNSSQNNNAQIPYVKRILNRACSFIHPKHMASRLW